MSDGSLLTLLRSVLDECRPLGTCLLLLFHRTLRMNVRCMFSCRFFFGDVFIWLGLIGDNSISVSDEALVVFVPFILLPIVLSFFTYTNVFAVT